MSVQIFIAFLIKLWIFSSNVVVSQNNDIRVPGAWQEISQTSKFCLMYKAPLKEEKNGSLAIFYRKVEATCLDSIIAQPLKDISVSNTPKVSLKSGKFEIEFKHENKNEKHSFPLWGDKINVDRNAYIGDPRALAINFLDPGSICGEECHLCPKGFSWVVTNEGAARICHPSKECGDRGQPACFLGLDWSKKKDFCVDNSKTVWCQQELKVHCSSDLNYLVCE